jgi:hypothetical protein
MNSSLSTLIAEWATRNPKIRRVWLCEQGSNNALSIALELKPVPDSEETMPVWIARCGQWRRELELRLGRSVDLSWLDVDANAGANLAQFEETNALVYERVH